jgi:transcriptional regulator GlxA family with amidase domain
MKIAFLLYEDFTTLDAIGPYEVLRWLPGAEILLVGKRRGIAKSDSGVLKIVTDHDITTVTSADILVVPGGPGQILAERDPEILEWVRAIHATTQFTTSVCTGSIVLGAAGLLRGLRATTHWMFLDRLREFGAQPTLERVVPQGKIVTAAGVSSGIDMALSLAATIAGPDVAQSLQLAIEYDPQPPFDAGSPKKAPEHVQAMVREVFAEFETTFANRLAAAS